MPASLEFLYQIGLGGKGKSLYLVDEGSVWKLARNRKQQLASTGVHRLLELPSLAQKQLAGIGEAQELCKQLLGRGGKWWGPLKAAVSEEHKG